MHKGTLGVCWESEIHGVSKRQTHILVSIRQKYGINHIKYTRRGARNIQEN